MRRLYFLVPSVESARAIVDDLLLARLQEQHIHVLARADTPMQGQLLMMIDVPRTRIEAFEQIVTRHHPEATVEGVETNIPMFP